MKKARAEMPKIGCVGHDCDDCEKQRSKELALKKEARVVRKALQRLSDAVLLHLHALDNSTGKDKTIPREASANLGRLATWLEVENDKVRFLALGVNFRKDDKAEAVRKIMRSNVELTGAARHEQEPKT